VLPTEVAEDGELVRQLHGVRRSHMGKRGPQNRKSHLAMTVIEPNVAGWQREACEVSLRLGAWSGFYGAREGTEGF
jgi:hypothetical protein